MMIKAKLINWCKREYQDIGAVGSHKVLVQELDQEVYEPTMEDHIYDFESTDFYDNSTGKLIAKRQKNSQYGHYFNRMSIPSHLVPVAVRLVETCKVINTNDEEAMTSYAALVLGVTVK